MYEVTRDSTDVDFDFATSVKLGPNVNHDGGDGYGKISSDGLTLIYGSSRPGGAGGTDVWTATRASRTDPFDPAVNLAQVNTEYGDATPFLSSDGLALFFNSTRPGGFGDPEAFNGGSDLYVSYRDDVSAPWQEPVNLGPDVNSAAGAWSPMLSADGSTLYFTSTRSSGIPNHLDFPEWVPVMDFYQVSVSPVPEPTSAALAAIALALLGCVAWRKRR
ncbi:MAG: PEP-CTERM sorting domain-containing protein [Gemmatimonadales bacterium]